MITNFLYRSMWFLVLLALQALVLDHMHIYGIAIAMVAPWLVMMLPQGTGRVEAQLWAFALGLACDVFAGTPGLQTAAMTLAGLVQQPLLRVFTPKDSVDGFTPSFTTLGTWGYMRYAFILLLLHHTLYFTLEILSLSYLLDSCMRAVSSLLLSYVTILCLERLRHHR